MVGDARELRKRLSEQRVLRVAGVHDGLSALIAERHRFDAAWASGLGISAAHGVPDASILTMTEFRDAAHVIDRSCGIPAIADCDTGFGDVRNLRLAVAEYDDLGIAAICIEDKAYPKRNSFSGAEQELADPHEFAAKIATAKDAQRDPDFMVIARLESFIAGAGVDDALARARLYEHAGADAVLVHSRKRDPAEVLDFAARWRDAGSATPLVAIPTTYPTITADELEAAGFSIVIYANQALRAAAGAMESTLREIARAGTSIGVEGELPPVRTIFELTGEAAVDEVDERFLEAVASARRADPSNARIG